MGFPNGAPAEPPAELSLREKVELGIDKSGVTFSGIYDQERLADAIMEVLQPPKPAVDVAKSPIIEAKAAELGLPVVDIPVVPTEGE